MRLLKKIMYSVSMIFWIFFLFIYIPPTITPTEYQNIAKAQNISHPVIFPWRLKFLKVLCCLYLKNLTKLKDCWSGFLKMICQTQKNINWGGKILMEWKLMKMCWMNYMDIDFSTCELIKYNWILTLFNNKYFLSQSVFVNYLLKETNFCFV